MNQIEIADILIRHGEGYRDRPYKDTLGIWTWGIGRNLESNPPSAVDMGWLQNRSGLVDEAFGSRDWLAKPPTLDELLRMLNPAMIGPAACKDFADYLLDTQVKSTDYYYGKSMDGYGDLDVNRRAVLLDMGFNMGRTWFMSWPNTMSLIRAKKWEDAAKAMLDSTWAKQVHSDPPSEANPYGSRAWYLKEIMRTGELPKWVKENA